MPKYLYEASYTAEGVKGLLKDGGTKRRTAVEDLVNSIGGKLEGFYFSFGVHDVVVIVDAPDNVSAATASLIVNATGAVKLKTTVLLTPEEMDAATKKTAKYRPPG